MGNKFVIYGAGLNGAMVLARHELGELLPDYEFAGFLDDHKSGSYANRPILGSREDLKGLLNRGIDNVAVAFSSDPRIRLKMCLEAERLGFSFPNLISPSKGKVLESMGVVKVGRGVYVDDNNVFMGGNQIVEDFSVVGPCAVVEGNVKIGRSSVLSPYVFVGSSVEIGEGCLLCVRSSLMPGSRIGNYCTVGPHVLHHGALGDGKKSLKWSNGRE